MRADIVIIGGGVIGAAIARELSRYSLNIILIEKEDDVAKDISDASATTYLVKKPDEVVVELTAAFDTNGTNGVAEIWIDGNLRMLLGKVPIISAFL